jgi:hypothetical protein
VWFQPNAIEAAELESRNFPTSRLQLHDETSRRSQARGQQALFKERLHRDHRQLLGDLHALTREERLIRSANARGIPVSWFK